MTVTKQEHERLTKDKKYMIKHRSPSMNEMVSALRHLQGLKQR